MENKSPGPFRRSLVFSIQLTALISLLHVLRVVTNFPPASWGILARDTDGLIVVVFAPLLHGSWGHLFSNIPPLAALTFMLFYFYKRIAWQAFSMIYLLTGVAVWGLGRGDVVHVGASGVVYGLVAFVFWSGIFRRNIKSIILALIVLMYYGSMFVGIFPGKEGISWESHLLGALAGIFAAFWYKNKKENDEAPPRYSWEDEAPAQDDTFFLDRDVFEKTKAERRNGYW